MSDYIRLTDIVYTYPWPINVQKDKGMMKISMQSPTKMIIESSEEFSNDFSEKVYVKTTEDKDHLSISVKRPAPCMPNEQSKLIGRDTEIDFPLENILLNMFNSIQIPRAFEGVQRVINAIYNVLMHYENAFFDVNYDSFMFDISVRRGTSFCTMWIQCFTAQDDGEYINYLCCQRSSGSHYVASLVFDKIHTAITNPEATASSCDPPAVCPLSMESLTSEQKQVHHDKMVDVVKIQIEYNNGPAHFSDSVNKVTEEALITLTELTADATFCVILLNKAPQLLLKLMRLAAKNNYYIRYFCYVSLSNLLDSCEDQVIDIIAPKNDRQPENDAEPSKVSPELMGLLQVLVNECGTGTIEEGHTRIAGGNLLHKLVSAREEIFSNDDEEVFELFDKLGYEKLPSLPRRNTEQDTTLHHKWKLIDRYIGTFRSVAEKYQNVLGDMSFVSSKFVNGGMVKVYEG